MGLLPKLRQTLSDASEREEILTTTSIPGLYWISTYRLRTAERSGILIQSPGQENVSVVFHAEDFTPSKHGGYDVYGLHMGQTDVLTFLATDNRIMTGHFVDCRAIDRFPEVRVNRYRAPRWLCSLARKSQRMQLRAGRNTHPFRFVVQGKTITFVPQDTPTT